MNGKCDKHGVFYQMEQLPEGKTREYCPECRLEEMPPWVAKLLKGNEEPEKTWMDKEIPKGEVRPCWICSRPVSELIRVKGTVCSYIACSQDHAKQVHERRKI